MADDDSDYELMPKREIERLKKEIALLKKNPYGESDKGKDLQQSIDKLNNTINKLIAILEDAQQDIIDEYQESKPVEKLNQILDQNETIAKALISINDKLSGKKNEVKEDEDDSGPIVVKSPQIPIPQAKNSPQSQFNQISQSQQFNPQFNPQFSQQTQFNQNQYPQRSNQQQIQQPIQQSMNQQYPYLQSSQSNMPPITQKAPPQMQTFSSLPPLDSMDSLPPLEGLDTKQMDVLPEKKKKFLGFI